MSFRKRKSKTAVLRKGIEKFIRKHRTFLAILIFAILLRFLTFTGLVACHSQDDGLYLNAALSILRGDFHFSRELIDQKYANPVWIPSTRIGMLYPTAFFAMIFGLKSFAFSIFPLLCSLGMLIAIYVFFLEIGHKSVGEIASLLLAVYPLNVIYSTRIMPDVPMTFFSLLGVLLFLSAEEQKLRTSYVFLSGTLIGFSYLIKPLGMVTLLPLMLISIVQRSWRKLLLLMSGFTLILCFEAFYFFSFTGDVLFKFKLLEKVYHEKYEVEYGIKEPQRFLSINFYLPAHYDFFAHARRLLDLHPFDRSMIFHGYLGVIGVLSAALTILWRRLRKFWPFIVLLLLVYLYLEFGATYVAFNEHGVDYFFIFKEADLEKQELLLVPLLCISIATVLTNIRRRELATFLLLILVFSSLLALEKTFHVFDDSVRDVRDAAKLLRSLPPKTVYTDYLAIGQLNYYLDFSYPGTFVNFYGKSVSAIKDGYVIVGGARGCDIVGDYIYSITPEFAFSPPSAWKLIAEFRRDKTNYRKVDMLIYEVE